VALHGVAEPTEGTGRRFDSEVPPMSQPNDDEVAHILTYVRNSFGNKGDAVSPEQVARVRATTERPQGAAH
ncbi:MAG: hypothetical protein KC656_11625, partial [Myxococcales bacterium]|nr:hypothetical protein [Myxococcales bacterium]